MASLYNINQIEDKHCRRFHPFVKSIDLLLKTGSNFLGEEYKKWLGENGSLELVQTAYAGRKMNTKGEEVFDYWDYPYKSELVDPFNRDLANNKNLVGVDVRVHDRFHMFQEKEIDKGIIGGFLMYSYSFDKEGKKYFCYKKEHNLLELKEHQTEKDLLGFLPIIDNAVFIEHGKDKSYLFETVDVTNKADNGDTQLLILSKKMGAASDNTGKESSHSDFLDSSIVCTFKVSSFQKNEISSAVINDLYDKIIYLIETYFDSPIIESKILKERNQHILSYHHTIASLYLYTYASSFKKALQQKEYDLINRDLVTFEIRMNKLRLIHYLLFEKEFLRLGKKNLAPPLEGTILEVIEQYLKKYLLPDEKVRSEITIKPGSRLIDIQEISTPMFVGIHDYILLISNLLDNACRKLYGTNYPLEIEISNVNGTIIIIKNHGIIDKAYLEFVNGISDTYPAKSNREILRKGGLEIIKELCNDESSLFDIKCFIENNETTCFEIKFAK